MKFGIENKALIVHILIVMFLVVFGISPSSVDIFGLSRVIPGIEKFSEFSYAKKEVFVILLVGWYVLIGYFFLLILQSQPFDLKSEYRHPLFSLTFPPALTAFFLFGFYHGPESDA